MLFISPPFGNYINLPNTTQIKGSFTLNPRDGLLKQIIKTLRYSSEYGGWINKIGLRNKGLDYAIKNYNTKDVYSIAILNKDEIKTIQKKIPDDMNIELNISCPNAEKKMISNGLQDFLNDKRKWCIIKVSPTSDLKLIDEYYKQGFRQFHCSNTIPVKEGGLSGKSLISYNNPLIKNIKSKYKDIEVIAGGGITEWNDIINYKNIGANHFSVSTVCFNPIQLSILYYNYVIKK
jgi:dihydroorotate dehydrogenase